MTNQEIAVTTTFGHVTIYTDRTLCFNFYGGFLVVNACDVSISPNQEPDYVVQFDPEKKSMLETSTSFTLWLNLTEDEANQIIQHLECFGEYRFSNQVPYWREGEND